MKPKSTHRYRVCGTPSKLGCITCKVRRVKCGEEKPFCKRCTSTGRKCDGYEAHSAPNVATGRKSAQQIALGPSEDDLEQQFLNHFAVHTAPILSGNFSPDFWERIVLQAALVEPSIRHAIVAIAAVHQDFNIGHRCHSPEHDSSLQAFAFRQYTKAISHLQNLMSTRTQELDKTLIACYLFICFNCLLGNHASAVMHLKAGLKILEDIKQRNPNKETYIYEWERELAPPLLSIGVQVATFISPEFPEERKALWTALRNAGICTKVPTLRSLDDARYALDSLCTQIMCDLVASNDSILDHKPPGSITFPGERYVLALQAWSEALERLLPSILAAEPPAGKISRGSCLLKIHASVISIGISLPNECEAKFEKILTLSESLVASNTSTFGIDFPTFSVQQGIIAPLFFAAWRAPDLEIKRRAIDLLSRTPGREGLWDASDAHRVAQDNLDKLQSGRAAGSQPVLSSSKSAAEFKIWKDIGTRLKLRMSWNFEKSESDGTDIQSVKTLQPKMPKDDRL